MKLKAASILGNNESPRSSIDITTTPTSPVSSPSPTSERRASNGNNISWKFRWNFVADSDPNVRSWKTKYEDYKSKRSSTISEPLSPSPTDSPTSDDKASLRAWKVKRESSRG